MGNIFSIADPEKISHASFNPFSFNNHVRTSKGQYFQDPSMAMFNRENSLPNQALIVFLGGPWEI